MADGCLGFILQIHERFSRGFHAFLMVLLFEDERAESVFDIA
jgi:hypothetical protein